MSKNQTDEATNRQVLTLQGPFGKALINAMPSIEQADDLIQDPSPIYEMAAKLFGKVPETRAARDIKRKWQKIYKGYFGKTVIFSDLIIPVNYDPKKHFGVIVAQGTTMNQAVIAIRKKFKVSLSTEDLDASVTVNDRVADKDYFIMFNKNVEADEDLKNLSANKLTEMEISGITLLERLLLEIYYYDLTKKHLDVSNWTLCSGSRGSGGFVPCVCWGSGRDCLGVSWYDPDNADDFLRSRAVVS